MMEQPVNLFVVGAMKAGTTGFVNVLSRHPDIYVPPIKEPNYFSGNLPRTLYTPSPFFNLGTYFKSRFPQPLHIAKLETGAQHKKLYSLQPETVTYAVDASTSYLHNPVAAKNIYGYNAQAKIIVLTRDPLQRAHSHYLMNRGLGREARSFENVMRAEIAQYKNNTLPWHSCLAMSFYGEAVRRYVSVFGENVKVVRFEALRDGPRMVFDGVSAFLGIDGFEDVSVLKQNKGRSFKFPKLLLAIQRLGLKAVFSKLLPSQFKRALFNSLSGDSGRGVAISTETKNELTGIFKRESPYYFKYV